MAPKREKKENVKKKFGNPFKTTNAKDPSGPSSSKDNATSAVADQGRGRGRRCLKYIYDKETKSCLGRTCSSWIYIILYSIIYLIFLSTYTMIFLFGSLTILKHTQDYSGIDKVELLVYSETGVGLSATPTSENMVPLIWYHIDREKTYQKYVNAIDKLLLSRSNSSDISELGPCAKSPFGYGKEPCVIIRINKHFRWAGKPLEANSSLLEKAPRIVSEWLRTGKKLWLHCDGYHPYDKEHIGKIRYYPNPPGIDPKIFPLDVRDHSPLVAVQFSGFTQGISIAVECSLWYDRGPSPVSFILFVEPPETTIAGNHRNASRSRF